MSLNAQFYYYNSTNGKLTLYFVYLGYGEDYHIKDQEHGSSSKGSISLATVLLGVVGVSAFYGPGMMAPMHVSNNNYNFQGRQLLEETTTATMTTASKGFLDGFLEVSLHKTFSFISY